MYSLCIFFLVIAAPSTISFHTEKHDTTKVLRLIELAKEKQKLGFPDSSEYYFKQAGDLAEKLDFINGKLLFAGNYSAFLYDQVRYDEAMEHAQNALKISLSLDNKIKLASAYNNIALQDQAQGRLKEAAKNLIRALDISNEIKNPTDENLSDRRKYLNNLSSLLLDLNDLDKGLHYAWRSYEIARELKDSVSMGKSLVNVMVAEAMAGKLDDAVRHGKEYLVIGRSFGDLPMEIKALNNLADVYRMQKRFPLALKTFNEALKITPATMPGNEVYSLTGMSNVFKEMGKPKEAKIYFERAFKLAKKELNMPQLADMYLTGAGINEALGDYKSALDLYKQHLKSNDSLRSNETQKTINELEVKYRAAQNREMIAERDLKIVQQEAELNRKNKWLIIYIFSWIILISGFFVFRTLYRQRRRTQETELQQKLAEAQLKGEEKERARTAKELHDGVASILSAAKLHLTAINDLQDVQVPFQDVSQLIDIAVREIRNISHNLAPEMILVEGLGYAIRSFCRRVNKPNFQLHCYIIGNLTELDKSCQLTIYRIVQESVTNILKHANASEGIVQLMEEKGRLFITIEDNGTGFDAESTLANGIGFNNLFSRIKLINGSIDIRSNPGRGTSVYITVNSHLHKSKRENLNRVNATPL
ncbi:tetratricopeptide repeat protein [Sphingobacterium olei]|uniref:histidine kinase n=1 Tax=Sphingobacterium olei TaxID=2571155 RepID=A0A4V5MN05_9SPHI|nr:tetratricopeptide repeat protein [Sphingobacterium olei]TJZ62898.1 tetratricopeptide repeat protein [Sphingobacterium olei]